MENQPQNTSVPSNGSRASTAAAAFDVPKTSPSTPVVAEFSPAPSVASLGSSQPTSPPATSQRPRPPRGRRPLWLTTGIVLFLIILGAVIYFWRQGSQQASLSSSQTADQFSNQSLPLAELNNAGSLVVSSRTLSVNGQLKVSGGVVIAPSTQPTTAVSGQIYYNQDTNVLSYYNGSQFIDLPGNGQVVQSLGGVSGTITLGTGLTLNAGQLRANGIVSFTSASTTLTVTNDGNGNVTLSDNRQTSVSGVQTNGGTVGRIAYFNGTSSIADSLLSQTTTNVDVAGTLSVADTFSLQSAATATINLTSNTTGVTGQIYNDGNLHITGGQNNLWLDAGGTGTIFLNSSNGNKVAIGESVIPSYPLEVNGDVNITASHAYRIDGTVICTISGCLSASATASLQTAYDNSIGNTTPEIKLSTAKGSVDIQDADSTIGTNLFNIRSSNAGGFGQILFGVGNNGAIAAQNAVNSTAAFVVENAAGAAQLTVDTTNSKVIIGALQTNSLTPTAALTVGSSSQSFTIQGNASSSLTATSGASTTSLVFQTPTASVTYRFLTAAAGTYDICTSVGNCAGAGSGVTTPGGTAGTIARFTAGQTIGDSIITDNGTTVTIGGALSVNTVTPTAALTVGATGQNLTLQGATVQLTSTSAGVTNSLVFATPASGNKTITIPNVTGTVCLDSGNCLGGGGGGANTSLSNLTGVAINTSLLPNAAGSINLGSGALPFGDLYLAGGSGTPATNNFRITGASTSGTRTITLPDASGTVCLQASASCGFIQNTTSLQTNANVAIQSAADSSTTLLIRQRATQSADSFRIENSSGGTVLNVDGFGGVYMNQSLTINKYLGVGMPNSAGTQIRVSPENTSTTALELNSQNGQTADVLSIQNNNASTASAIKVNAGNNSNANTAWSSISFNVTNSQGTTAVSTGTIAGLDLQFTQNPTVAGNTETVANLAVKQNDTSVTDNTVSSILNVANNDTATGNQITVTDGIKINGANLTNGINLSGTFGSNLITSTNFVVAQGGLVKIQGGGTNGSGGQLQFGSDGQITLGEDTGDSDVFMVNARVAHRFYIDGTQVGEFGQNGLLTVNSRNSFGGLNVVDSTNHSILQAYGDGSQVQIGYADTIGALLVLDTKTNAGDPTGINGGMYYNSSSGKLRCFEGGSWSNCTGVSGATLQTAYNNSTSPEIVLNSTNGALTVRDASTPIGANLLEVQDNGGTTNYFAVSTTNVSTNVPLRIKSATDSTTAFNVKTSLDNNAFTVDTLNSRVGINLGGNNTPTLNAAGLEIKGALRLSGSPTDVDKFVTPLGTSLDTKVNIPLYTVPGFSQVLALGLDSTSSSTARGIMLADARTVAHQPTVAVLSPNENNVFGLSWDGGNTVGLLKTTTDTIAIQGFSGSALNIATFKAFSGTDGRLGVNNGSPSYTIDAGGDINTSTQYRIGGTTICTSSGCTPTSGSGSYIQNGTAVQSANMFIQASNTTAPTAAFEQAASGSADVLDVLKNDGTTKYLSVSSAGNLTVANGSTYSLSSNTSGSLTSNGSITVTAGGASTWSTSSGNLTIQAATTSTLALQTGGAGTVSLGNQNTTTINIGAGSNIARTIHIGDAGTSQAQTITLGSNGGTSTTTVQGGTGSTAVNITTGTNGYINLITSGSGNINLIAGGTITNKVTTDSTTAYQVQNASGAALVNVDTVNSNISLLGNNSPTLTTWATTTAMTVGSPNTRVRGGAVAANGYLYHLGGVDGNGTTIATVEYSKINADGTIGTWASTTSLPNAVRQFQPVVANGYIYVIGGRDNSNATLATSYYAKINNDGTLGAWNTTTALSSGAQARFGQGTIAYNGYMYVLGGFNSSVSAQGSVLYNKINADGTLGSSWTATTSFSTGLANINGATVANGYAYAVGGWDGTTDTDYVRRAKINNDGTMGSWTNQTGVVPGGGDENFLTFVSSGYLYVVGGDNGSRTSVFPLNADGSVGSVTSLTAFPVNMGEAAGAAANGYFYVLGGSAGSDGSSTVRNTVYYASTSRVKVGGNLDLVSYGGENLSEGSTGGQLTAGDTAIVGTMQVQGDATFARNLTVGGTLTVNNGGNIQGSSAGGDILDLKNSSGTNVLSVSSIGAAQLQNSFDSIAAFTVKNAAGTSTLINADTTNGRVGIGGVASFSKFEVQGGDAAIYNNGGNPRLIIGNSTSAGQNGFLQYDSSNNYLRLETTGTNGLKVNDNYVTIGNIFPNQPLTVANGTTQLFQVTTTGTVSAKTTTNNTAGFQVQNSGGVEQLTVDTSNSRVYVGPTAGDTTGTILVLGNKTNAGDPTGVAGAMYYNANGGKFRCYENGAWKNCLGFNANLSIFGGDGNGAAAQWTNMAAALTEIFTPTDVSVPSSRLQYDLTDAQQVRFQVNVAVVGAASAELRIQYSTDQSTWNYLDSGNTGLGQNISTTGFKSSSWSNIASGAKGDVYLRVVGINGDGALDPRFGLIQVQAR